MKTKVHKIGNAKLVEEILEELHKKKDSTEELVVLRSYRDTETGIRNLEWWSTELDSCIWTIGALNYLAIKMEKASSGWEDET